MLLRGRKAANAGPLNCTQYMDPLYNSDTTDKEPTVLLRRTACGKISVIITERNPAMNPCQRCELDLPPLVRAAPSV